MRSKPSQNRRRTVPRTAWKKGQIPPGAKPFPKGVSGNPGGITKEIAAARDEARRKAVLLAPAAIEHLGKIIKAAKKGTSVSRQAADSILDRALGRAAQSVTVKGDADNPVAMAHRLAREVLRDPQKAKELDDLARREEQLVAETVREPGGVCKPSE